MVIPVYAVDEIIERKVERISENFTSTFNYQHNCNLYNETLLQEKIENNDIIKSVVESLNVSCKKQIFFDNTVLFVNFLMFSYVMGSMIGIVLMSFGVGALRGRVPNNNLNN
ncbi:MAG: hypothetical protein LBM05_02275 [Endomicrobium sp.]|jgi:hypothetical protein|nr:hypothetical protein [Endomicrobium sp.]